MSAAELEALTTARTAHRAIAELVARQDAITRDFYRYQDAGGTADWPTWRERYRGDYE